jgi:hypothetical protein
VLVVRPGRITVDNEQHSLKLEEAIAAHLSEY